MTLTPELLKKARGAKSEKDLILLAKENDLELTEENAKRFYAKFHQETELEDSELDNIAGGCGGGDSSSSSGLTVEQDADGNYICPNCGGLLLTRIHLPDGNWLFICDLGCKKEYIYSDNKWYYNN